MLEDSRLLGLDGFVVKAVGERDDELVIAIERHALLAAPNDQIRQEVAEPVTV